MKYLFFITLTIVFLTTHKVFSQSEYRLGYIITYEGDTINGYLNYRVGNYAFQNCDFSRSEMGKPQTFHPKDIAAYGFTADKHFETKRYTDSDGKLVNEFIEVIIRGEISLYKSKNFFIEKDSTLYSLNTEYEEVKIDGVTMQVVSKRSVGILNYLLSGCPELAYENSSYFNEKSLTEVIVDYHICIGATYLDYKKQKEFLTVVYTLDLSLLLSSVKVAYFDSRINEEVSWKAKHTGVTLGANVNIGFPRMNDRLNVQTGLHIMPLSYQANFENKLIAKTLYNDIEMTTFQLRIPIGVRYTYTQNVFKPYIKGGLSAFLNFGTNTKWIIQDVSNGMTETDEYDGISLHPVQIGFWGGVGFSRFLSEHLGIYGELRFELATSLIFQIHEPIGVGPNEFNNNVNNLYITIGVSF